MDGFSNNFSVEHYFRVYNNDITVDIDTFCTWPIWLQFPENSPANFSPAKTGQNAKTQSRKSKRTTVANQGGPGTPLKKHPGYITVNHHVVMDGLKHKMTVMVVRPLFSLTALLRGLFLFIFLRCQMMNSFYDFLYFTDNNWSPNTFCVE